MPSVFRVAVVKVDVEHHPNQDDWGFAQFTVLVNRDLEALVGEPDTNEFNVALDLVTTHIEKTFGYNVSRPYSGGPGRPFVHGPSVTQVEWDGDLAVRIGSRFGMDV